MIRFNCDYLEGAHPRILQRLLESNMEQTLGYGEDEYCERARALIREQLQQPEAYVQFLVGGTQANMTVLAAALRPWQGVISAHTGHIAVHESGAIEAGGHKVIALPGNDGKISAAQVDEYCDAFYSDETHEHMVMPKAVYISFPTELGTLYSKSELTELRRICDKWHLTLFLDGARLGYGLAASENDLDLPAIARLCDVFYIGGTKQGLLMGEAVVLMQRDLREGFRSLIKQKGGLLAKGRLLGLQFEEAFRDGLYFDLSRHAIEQAERLREAFSKAGCSFYGSSPTNQVFPVLPNGLIEQLKQNFSFEVMQPVDEGHTVTRFCTSWATRPEDIDALSDALGK